MLYNYKACKKCSSGLRLPADATSASRTNGLGIIDDTKRATDKLGGEIDRGTPQELERYGVYNDAGLSHDGVLKYIVLRSVLPYELHLVLISMTSTRFDRDSQGRTRIFSLRRYSTELLRRAFCKDQQCIVLWRKPHIEFSGFDVLGCWRTA